MEIQEVHFLSERILMAARFVDGKFVGAIGCSVHARRYNESHAIMSPVKHRFEDLVVLDDNLHWIGREVDWDGLLRRVEDLTTRA